MLVGGVRQDELGDHAHAPPVGLTQEVAEIAEVPVGGMDLPIVRNVVAVVTERRRIEGQEPEGGDAQALQVVELLDQTLEVADPVAVAVPKGTNVRLVNDGVLVPGGLVSECLGIGGASFSCHLGGGHEGPHWTGALAERQNVAGRHRGVEQTKLDAAFQVKRASDRRSWACRGARRRGPARPRPR